MRLDRRGFLRTAGGALALAAAPTAATRAADGERGVHAIHRETRNTRLGAVGRVRALFTPSPDSTKEWSGRARIALPADGPASQRSFVDAVGAVTPAAAFAPEPIALDELARLLRLANGITGPNGRLRAAPSAGALYAGEVYVAALRVDGLEPGVYAYAVPEDVLVPVGAEAEAIAAVEALSPSPAADPPAALVLLSNVFGRYAGRYANRGYRYALIDSGHIGENLRLAAAAAGLAERPFVRFHDAALDRAIGVDGRAEAVCAVHAVGRAAEGSGFGGRPDFLAVDPSPVDEEWTAFERFHARTRLAPAAASDAPPATQAAAGRPRLDGPPLALERAIRRRRSAREFTVDSAPREAFEFVARAARGRAAHERHPGVELWVAAHRVDRVVPGLYRYDPASDGFELRQRGALHRAMVRACLGQKKAGRAAMGFAMVGRLAEQEARAGPRSYRDLLVESGAVGERIYLAAQASGLAARNLAAFVDDDLNELFGLDGRNEAVIHLTMVGPGEPAGG